MPGNGDNTHYTVTYPTNQQYSQWKAHADELDMSLSEFIKSMVESGRKKFNPRDVTPDETNLELREQRNNLKHELDHTRDRVHALEEQLYHSERATIQRYIADHPGATYGDIVQHVVDTVPERVNRHLNGLEGETVRAADDAYYPLETTGDDP